MLKSAKIQLLLSLLLFGLVLTSCHDDGTDIGYPEPEVTHTPAVQALQRICQENSEVRQLLEHSIRQAAAINPDRNYNPAQTLEEFYTFVDRNVRYLPWDVMIHPSPTAYGKSLWGRADQGVGYFWFVVDQPLDELKDRGYFYPTVEFVEPFSSWLTTYAQSWGDWLSTEDSWNNNYYQMVLNDPDDDWGLRKGWYGEGNRWKTFNEFFARQLVSPDVRPIADAAVVSPVDGYPKVPKQPEGATVWQIDDQNQLVYTEQVKTAKLRDIAQLIGSGSQYQYAFAGGVMTHAFLDVNCYHRYHSPVDGVLKELRRIPGVAAGGGYTLWNDADKLYYYENPVGFQMVETRACAIIETADYGLVAMLPVGMSQICSVNWLSSLQVGQTLKRGDEMGYFLFGGSDVILLFQKDISVTLACTPQELNLMGTAYATLTKK